MLIPYWLQETIVALPLALWIFAILGIPWALVVLPRQDWRDRILVGAVAFAFGPALLTSWMFILGTIGGNTESPLMRFDLTFWGTLIIAMLGFGLAWRKSRNTTPAQKVATAPLTTFEKTCLILIIVAVGLRFFMTAYWPFTAYDSLWVYGYQSRLYTLNEFILADIGYYPQFLQLQYTFMQLGMGGIDDHAARLVLPFLQVGSILAAYVLGSRLFNRRAGILTATIWTLYPHVGEWIHVGDLEIPMTFLFTLSSAFFLMAWVQNDRFLRRRYALLAGLVFGITMWTKPTAGAFVWGVMLLVAIDFSRVKFDIRRWYPRFEVAAITGLACIPLGAAWYVRNIFLGHPPIVLPHESWLSQATRSGDLFSWPILALGILCAYVITQKSNLRSTAQILIGFGLILAGLVPTVPWINPLRVNPPLSYISLSEALLVMLGLIVITHVLWRHHRTLVEPFHQLSWAELLALPYFVTWFYSYSYHYRLVFAIVPLMILPTAVILAKWSENWQPNPPRKFGAVVSITIAGIASTVWPLILIDETNDWLWTDHFPTDYEKYEVWNPGVRQATDFILGYISGEDSEPVVVAPGEDRLPFFFPELTIHTEVVPTTLADLEALGATHYLYGNHARWFYEEADIVPEDTQIVLSFGRGDVMTELFVQDDSTFRYELYLLHLADRFTLQDNYAPIPVDEAPIIGEALRYRGLGFNNTQFAGGAPANLRILWEVLQPLEGEYKLRVDLLNGDDGIVYNSWDYDLAPGPYGNYRADVWEVGEFFRTSIRVQFRTGGLPKSQNYRLVVNFVHTETGEVLPITLNGEPLPDGYALPQPFAIGNPSD